MNKIIEEKSQHEGPIKHYKDNHDVVPFWVLVKYLTMRNISYLFDILDTQIKNRIAKQRIEEFTSSLKKKIFIP